MNQEQNKDMIRFVEMPAFKAVLENVLPAMAAMVMVLVYNLADTFFIGRTNDPYQVAAISMCTPLFMLCVTLGTVFGVGGTSLISRTLGEGNPQKAKKICSFCFYGGAVCGVLLALVLSLFSSGFLKLMGAQDQSFAFAKRYLVVVAAACPFAVITNSYSNIVRSEGNPKGAMTGLLLGNLINIVLDPIFISLLKMGIAGAAVATIIGNMFGALYYIRFYVSGKAALSIKLKDFAMNDKIASGVLAIGIPAALGSFTMTISQIIANKLMMDYGDLAVAGFGVAGKINMIAGMLCMGVGQGVQPLIGFCVGSKNKKRYKELIRVSLLFSLALGIVLSLFVLILRRPLVLAFLRDAQAVGYAVPFTAILISTGVLFGIFYVLVSILQAMGKGLASLFANLSRQGIVFIPAVYLLKAIMGINGVVWAQPVADFLSLVFASVLCIVSARTFLRQGLPEAGPTENN